MLPITSILFPTDFSRSSAQAFEVACALARDYEASLTVLHVKPPPAVMGDLGAPEPADEELLLAKLAMIRPANPFICVEHQLLAGDPASEIVRRAEKVDLIVMGTHGRSGLARLLMGSVAETVLRRALCPVLTVKSLPASEEAKTSTASAACLA